MSYHKMERRQKRRIDAVLSLDILYENNKLSLNTKNISMLGACAENEQEIKAGTKLKIIIHIPLYGHYRKAIEPVKCQGLIFRSTSLTQPPAPPLFNLGIFFADFETKEDADRLSSYIDYIGSKEKTFVKHRLKQLRAKLKREKAAEKKAKKNKKLKK